MIKRILVGLTGTSYSQAATQAAIDIAKRRNAEITAVTAVDFEAVRDVGPVPIGAGQEARELREHRVELTKENMEAAIEQFTSSCQKAEIACDVLREERENPFDYLLSQFRYHDLTILGLRGIFEYGIPGLSSEDPGLTLVNLLSGGLRPILAVPTHFHTPQRVMVAYSGSVESAATLKRFVQLQPFGQVQLRLVTFGEATRCQHLLQEASRYCSAHGFTVETHHVEGDPQGHVLEEAAAWKADLIVMGNSAKSLLLRRVLGETALRAIRNSELPLFLAQ